MKSFPWTRVLRRTAALFLATVSLWLLTLTTDFSGAAAAFKVLGESPAIVAAALSAELGKFPQPGGPVLDPWMQLAVDQSPLLASAGNVVTPQQPKPEPEPLPEPDDPQDPVQLPAVTQAPDDIQAQTLQHQDGNLSADALSIFNTTSLAVDVAALAAAPVTLEANPDGPQILIMHTHGTEAYTMDGTDIYLPSDTSRTIDPQFNMVRVGEEMAQVLTEMGFSVLHDTTLYDYPAYSGAYDRSKAGVEQWLRDYPSIQVVLDVHRDALTGENGETYKTLATVNGAQTAQLMLVVGSSDAGLEHPHWKENLSLALKLQSGLLEVSPSLPRPITLRTNRFNQQLTTGSLLVEVGSHGNTLQEALAAARLFARTAGETLKPLLLK